jgi:two-component system cell cycle sensor histidine kinase/response regulator CckA
METEAQTDTLLVGARDLGNPDYTDPVEAESRLKRSEARYRRLFESAQDGILILEAGGGHIADANPFLLDFLGYSRDELLGKQLWEIGLFEDIEANRKAFQTLKEKGYIRYEDLPLKTKLGESREVEFVSNTYDVGDEKVIQCNIRDITDRKKAERDLYESAETRRQGVKMEAMGRLSGGIAHDFNNMLTAISGCAGLSMTMVEPKGTLHDYLDQILKAGARASALTKQLLAFSRQQILAPKVLGLNAIVLDMQIMLARLIGDSVRVKHDLDPNLGLINADLTQIQQIIMNLVINARDSMPHGGEIRISTSNAGLVGEYAKRYSWAAFQDHVVLSVRDTGMGMTPEIMDRIFDPFFTTKEIGKGTGMGLATVQGIVEQSGGHITVQSIPGKGSEFLVFLPRTGKEDGESGSPPLAELASFRGTETVLLAEDDAMVRSFIRKALEMFGYRVVVAANGSAAAEAMESYHGPIHLLLTDLMMPHENGKELAQRFLRLRPASRVLFMSGYTDDVIMQQDLIEDGVTFIQKPFGPADLSHAVRKILDKLASAAG